MANNDLSSSTRRGFATTFLSNLWFICAKTPPEQKIRIAGLQPRQIIPSKILEQRKNELLKILPDWNNAEQSAIFAENFFPDYQIDSLKKEAQNLYSKAGKIIAIKATKPENQLRGSFIIEGKKINMEVYFTLSPENPALIQEYHIKEVPKIK